MSDESGCGVIVGIIAVGLIMSASYCTDSYNKGRRDERCRNLFSSARTASDSLAISRDDERCAVMIRTQDGAR